MNNRVLIVIAIMAIGTAGVSQKEGHMNTHHHSQCAPPKVATFGGGCFWCMEAVFERIPGVLTVTPGYMGGSVENPTYQQVSRGNTGHAEVVHIEYDPKRVAYQDLLEIFWKAHDPTQLNRQGADIGTQYRSVVFYHDDDQKQLTEASKQALNRSGRLPSPVVTEVAPASVFYAAEEYHHAYFQNNPDAPYSRHVIRPKLENLELDRGD